MHKIFTTLILLLLGFVHLNAQNNQSVKDDPKGAWEFEKMRLADPATGEIPYDKIEKARKQAREQILQQRAQGKGPQDFGNWTERGPNNFGGRTRAIMWDPNDPDHKKVWAGGVDGGLWVNEDITDENSQWSLKHSFYEGFAISCIAYDPDNSNTFYIGTGELYGTGERFNLDIGVRGNGVYISNDGGTTWSKLGNSNFLFTQKIIVRDQVIYAATESGLYRYDNAWTLIEEGIYTDIEECNGNLYITRVSTQDFGNEDGRIYKLDSQDQLHVIYDGLGARISERTEMAINDLTNELVCIFAGLESVLIIEKTILGSNQWNEVIKPKRFNPFNNCSQTDNGFAYNQAYYNLLLSYYPNTTNKLILGGIDLYITDNGGTSWSKISDFDEDLGCGPQYVHADQHNIAFNPNNDTECIISNDGGVYYCSDINAGNYPSFESRNNMYSVTQFYTCYPDNDDDFVLGGTQDNGTILVNDLGNDDGDEVLGGDGGFCFVDDNDQDLSIISTYYTDRIKRSFNYGNTYYRLLNIDEGKGLFINPMDYDNHLNILYIYYSKADRPDADTLLRIKGMSNWGSNKDILEFNLSHGVKKVTNITLSRHIGTNIYASVLDNADKVRLYKIESANMNSYAPSEIYTNDLPEDGYISKVTIGKNEDEILVCYSNYSDTANIWHTTNGGNDWFPKRGIGLPKIPVRWAEFNPTDTLWKHVLIATEVGLYQTYDITQNNPVWEHIDFDQGTDPSLSLVRCDMIRVRPSDAKVYVATHGRGIWESDIFMNGTNNADLVVYDVNPLVNEADLNQSFLVDVTIKNNGTADAPYNTSQCFISDDDELSEDDQFIFQYSMGNISPGQTLITSNWDITIPCSAGLGNKYLLFVADGLESIDEGSNESNNVLPIPIHISSSSPDCNGPDLTVLNEFVSKRVIQQDQSFSVNCDILNQGNEDATGGWRQKWYLSTDQTYSSNDLQLDFLLWATLPSDSTRYIHREMTIPSNVADGVYYILIYIDANEELIETVETNNIKSLAITVGTIPVPELYSPMDDEEEVSFNPTFYWENLGADVDSYDFAIYDYVTQNGNTYLQQVYYKGNLTEPEWQVTNFNFDYAEGYMWTARCRVDGTHGEWAIVHRFQTKHYLSMPVLYDPNNYITNEPLSPTFTWNNVNNASSYKLVIATDEEFDDEVEDWSGLTDNWFTIPPNYLDTATVYFWRVKAYAGAGNSAYSQVFQFSTGGNIAPGIPENRIPVHDSANVSLSPQLSWETGNGVTLSYQIDIASDSIFNTIVFTQNNITTTNYFMPSGYLGGLTKYYWRVRAWNGAGYSAFSDPTAFTTTTEGGPGTIKWISELGDFRGTPAFDYQGYLWCSIGSNLAKINPTTGDTLFTLAKYAWQEFDEGITLSHDGRTIYTVVAASVFGDGDGDHVAALNTNGNLLWHYDTYCGNVSKPALDVNGNLYINLSDGFSPYENEASVISLDPTGNLRWRGLVFNDHEEFVTCPVVGGNKVFLGRERVDNVGSVFALNTENGSTEWARNFQEDRMSSDVPGISNLGFTFNSYSNEYLYYLNSSNGNNLSGWPFNSNLDNLRAATVIDENGTLFNGTDEEDGSSFVYGLNQNGSIKWQNQIYFDYCRSQVLGNNGILYFGVRNNVLHAVNKETGIEEWSLNLNRSFYEMTIGPDGTLYVSVSNPDGLLAIETSATGLNTGYWPVKVHDYQGTNCYDHVALNYSPTLLEFAIKNDQDTTRTIENFFNYNYLNIATHYKISEDSLFTTCDWIALDSNYQYQISSEYGYKSVYFVLKNDTGTSDTISDMIEYVTSKPIIVTDSISQLNISDVELLGKVNPNNLNTHYYFEYGTSESYGFFTDTSLIIAGTNVIATSQFIDGLLPATTYHYRITAFNSGGMSNGVDKTFTTHGLFIPQNLQVSVNGYNTTLNWSPPNLECFNCLVLGYNIYRNSVLINTQLVTSTDFADSALVNGIYQYTISAIYAEGESSQSDPFQIEIAGGGFPEGWNFLRTQNPHVIIIPIESNPTINGTPISKGDYLGVFFKRGNEEVCGGACRWNGSSAVSLIAYGNDSLSLLKDGFGIGEQMVWKIKSWDIDSIMEAIPSYDHTYSHWDGNYFEFGLSGIESLVNKKYQSIEFQAGWNIASFFVTPQFLYLDSIFQPLTGSNTLVKIIDEAGGFLQYIPGVGWLNTIGDMANTEGYYIKVNTNDLMTIAGIPVNTPYAIPLQTGWNIMGYPVQTPQSAVNALQPLITEGSLKKIIDESGGFIQNIPGVGWMNTIGNFEPGEGYYIKVNTNTALVLDEPSTKATSYQSSLLEGIYYTRNSQGNPYMPMHIIATFDENMPLMQGDELGIFINDTCYGSVYFSDMTAPVVAFVPTDDPTTTFKDGGVQGDELQFKLLHLGEEYVLSTTNNEIVTFESLGTKLVDFNSNILGLSESSSSAFKVSEVIPNPFSREAKLFVTTPKSGSLNVSIVDLRGVIVKELFAAIAEKGKIEVPIDGEQLNPGMYFVRVEYMNNRLIKEVLRKVIVYGN